MRPSPTPPDRPWRGSFGRWVVVAACVALAAVHVVRAVSVASDYPYLALLGAVAAVAALGCAAELARVDDSISWMFATALAVILLAGYLIVLVFGLPGEHDARATPAIIFAIVACLAVIGPSARHVATIRRAPPLRTQPHEPHVARARRGTEQARRARPGRARQAV